MSSLQEELLSGEWEETCCGPTPVGEIFWTWVSFLLIALLVAAFFQFWIYKKPGTVWAKICKYLLYAFGAIFSLGFFELMRDLELDYGGGASDYRAPLFALVFGLGVSSCFLVTHYLVQGKKNLKSLFWKILLALIIFQVLMQIDLKLELMSKIPIF